MEQPLLIMDFGFTKNIIINYYFFISRNKKLLLLFFSWNYKYDKSAIFSEADILLHYSLKNFLDIWVTYLLSSKKTIIYKEYNRWHEYYFSFSRFCLLLAKIMLNQIQIVDKVQVARRRQRRSVLLLLNVYCHASALYFIDFLMIIMIDIIIKSLLLKQVISYYTRWKIT